MTTDPAWCTRAFDEMFSDATAGNPRVDQRDFQPRGVLPVVDQGQDHLGGYTNDPALACNAALPCIVFGDHTKTVKYVDHPFAIGAQGVRILIPREGIDPRFAFHALFRVPFPGDTGYSRHYRFLKRSKFSVPPLHEQRRIAAVLDKVDAIRRKRQEGLRLLRDLVRSAFLEMFGDPVSNEKGWAVAMLQELIDPLRPITYGILKPGPNVPNGVPYVRVVDIADGTVHWQDVKRTTQAIAHEYRRSTLRVGDLLLSIRGHVGRVAAVPPELDGGNITQDTARLAVLPRYAAEYVAACLASEPMQLMMRRFTKGVAVTGINLADVRKLPLPVPPSRTQERFKALATRHAALTARAVLHQNATDGLVASLVHRAFRGDL